MARIGPNHSVVVWAACFLWLTSIFEIIWSLLLFFCVGDILLLTGTDLVNAFVLLSGVIMLPTNLHMLYSVAHGRHISHKDNVICCPVWICIFCVIVINLTGAILCLQRVTTESQRTYQTIKRSMQNYKDLDDIKNVVDKVQWNLKCCGVNSYRDWFSCDWYDKVADSENDFMSYRVRRDDSVNSYLYDIANTIRSTTIMSGSMDSVPFSCCKGGFCMPQFLSELGVGSINTVGCGNLLHRIVVFSMTAHILVFISVIIVETILLRFVIKNEETTNPAVVGIMSVNENFVHTSTSHVFTGDVHRSQGGSVHGTRQEVLTQVMQDIYKDEVFVHPSGTADKQEYYRR